MNKPRNSIDFKKYSCFSQTRDWVPKVGERFSYKPHNLNPTAIRPCKLECAHFLATLNLPETDYVKLYIDAGNLAVGKKTCPTGRLDTTTRCNGHCFEDDICCYTI